MMTSSNLTLMASPKCKYSPIPPPEHHHHHHHHHPHHPPPPPPLLENYVALPYFHTPGTHHRCHINLRATFLLVAVLALALFVLWPSDPDLKIVRVKLLHLKVHVRPRLSVDLSMATTVKVRNRDAYTVDFDGLHVAIGYRGRELGHVTSREGHVAAWGSSYVDAVAEFNRVEVIHGWVYLLEDLVKGTVPFDTVSTFKGQLGFFFFEIPLKAKISCEIDVNVKNQTISRQNCYPE